MVRPSGFGGLETKRLTVEQYRLQQESGAAKPFSAPP
jgi:hypothetical protein